MTRSLSRIFLILTLAGTSLSAQRAPIAQQLVFTPYHDSGIYDVGDTVGWTVTPVRLASADSSLTAGGTPPTYAYKFFPPASPIGSSCVNRPTFGS